jgi:hypothetical protein
MAAIAGVGVFILTSSDPQGPLLTSSTPISRRDIKG